jgi:hypothetical protein
MSDPRGSSDGTESRPEADGEVRTDRLGGVRALPRDEDERPSREDMDYGHTIFTRRPVPLPRWLGGGKRKSS